MNYPCIRCVVEYLEANQRFLLSSKCPSIRKVERSIPLHLDCLEFRSTTITINQFDYALKKNVLENTNNERRDDEQSLYNYQIARSFHDADDIFHNNRNEKEILKKFPEGVPLDSAMKWMGCFFFEGRRVITTKRLKVGGVTVLQLPENFKIKVTNRFKTTMSSLEGSSKFIVPKVEKLAIFGFDRIAWNHHLVWNSRQVYIRWIEDDFLNCTHKNVMLDNSLPEGLFERLIRKWIADRREIGFSFCFIEYKEQDHLETLFNFKKMFGGRAVDRKMTEEEKSSNLEIINLETREERAPIRDSWNMIEPSTSNNGRKLLYCICLPMNSTSELQISLFGGNQWTKQSKIDMEVVPIKSLPTLKFDHVEYQMKKEERQDTFDAIIAFLGILLDFSSIFIL